MPGRVSLFVTCVVDQVFPRAGMAMAEVIGGLGYEVEFREAQTCCGQPAFNSGYHKEAAEVAEHFIRTFRDATDYIVVPSGSCTSMITHHFRDLFPPGSSLREETEYLAPRVFEFTQFLTQVAKVEDVGARWDGVVTYHDSCHALRELKIKDAPRLLLRNVKGLELREMGAAEECCGFGGTFSIKFPEVSGGMARTKIESILATGASTVVSIDSSCLMQLQGAIDRVKAPLRTVHLAEILASR
ncbi:MAG: (Fe-S)-binding protein [Acidobacteria bacterium]|nr:(Fe-S)-binding protein [Acidobacteriota bacterium]